MKSIARAAALALAAAPVPLLSAAAAPTVVVQWNEVTIAGIIATKPPPTAAARALALVATAIYDAWTAFDPVAAPVDPLLPGPGVFRAPAALLDPTDKATALSYAAYTLETNLFPTVNPVLPAPSGPAAAQLLAQGLDPTDTTPDPTTAAGIGILAAQAVIAARAADNSNQGGLQYGGTAYSDYSAPALNYTAYVPLNAPYSPILPTAPIAAPNAWQPLSVPTTDPRTAPPPIIYKTQKYATPFWGLVTPFTALPPFWGHGPATYPSWQYTFDTDLLLYYSATLNDTTKTIADYWADSPGTQLPPGHWARIGEFISQRDSHGTDADAKMFFALNNALLDAGIVAWKVKRVYNSERPITSTHELYNGKPIYAWAGYGLGSQWIDGGTWLPYQQSVVITPAFPEYISGHSTFSAAAATVLQNFTNSDYLNLSYTAAPGSSNIEPGFAPGKATTLYFPTLSSAASQAGQSRLYGGIHFTEGNVDGRFAGRTVGQFDWWQAQSYFNGGGPINANTFPPSNGFGHGHRYGDGWGAQPGPGWGLGFGGWGGDWGGD